MSCVHCGRFVWPRDLCYVRYWRRNDDGSYGRKFVFFCSVFSLCDGTGLELENIK